MSKGLIMHSLIVICFGLSAYKVGATVQSVPNPIPESVFELNSESLKNKSKDDLEKEMGRPLKFKEKAALKLVKRKLKKNEHLNGTDALEDVHTEGLAIAGFTLGLIALFVMGIILGPLAFIFSAIALYRILKQPATRKGKGLSIAGMILGVVAAVGWFVVVVFFGD